MIDSYCHVLPGLDDGARDMQDSVAMACQADSASAASSQGYRI